MDATENEIPPEEGVRDDFAVIRVDKKADFQGRKALEEYLPGHPEKFVVCVDASVDPDDLSTVMWKVFNNIDAERDLYITGQRIGIDATKKYRGEGLLRDWPDDIVMTDDMIQAVTGRWSEYGIHTND